jgi:parallel beta-helix repeat protein
MTLARRSVAAIAVFVLIGALVLAGRWYESRQTGAEAASGTVTVNVTNGADRGPGTLREALFVVATGTSPARIVLQAPHIALETALPPIVNPHGVRIVAQAGHGEIDAHALTDGPVFDVAGANTSIEGITVRGCRGAAILVRAGRFHLQSSTLAACDVGVDVAANASDLLIEHNRFPGDRIGVRFAAASRDTSVLANEFTGERDAGVWAVRSEPDLRGSALTVRDNHFDHDHAGVVAGNIPILVERNEIIGAEDSAVHLVGTGAVIRGNRVSGGPSFGIVAEGAREAVIEGNELDGLAAYGIMVRGSSNALVRGNRLHNCGYGLAFVLGDARNPSTAVDNIILESRYDGIDVIGDSPILRRNQVLRPHALALRVSDFQPPSGAKIAAAPFLDGNTFGGATLAANGRITESRR